MEVETWFSLLSPGQTESQVDASWKLRSTCHSVWPGLACTCVDLRWLALNLVEMKFAQKSFFHRLANQPKLIQVERPPLIYWLASEIQDMSAVKCFILRLACTCEEPCQSVWPPNASLYATSTCRYLRLLASPFGQPHPLKTRLIN